MIQYWISRRKRLKIEYGVGWQPRVVPDRTVLVAEPRDELVCRALGAVLNQKQPSSSSKYFQE
jgi:hypothetical protein